MIRMLFAEAAILTKVHFGGLSFFIPRFGVVPPFALGALELNDIAHGLNFYGRYEKSGAQEQD